MIRVIIERCAREAENLPHLLRELRTEAVHCPGYVSGETLVSTEDSSAIVVIGTWQSLEDWQAWEKSPTRARLYQQIEPLLREKPKISTYRIAATESNRH
jgi:quinol monooxygenase YgiN